MAALDEAALSDLYDRFSGRLYGLIMRILGDETDAGDVLIDVFTRAWRRAPDYDPTRSTVGTWLCVMARSKALDMLRARRSRQESIARAAEATPHHPPAMGRGSPSLAEDAETKEMRRHIDHALDTLNADQRRAIELAYFHGLSQSQIAELVQAPLGTIKTRIRTGMGRLRELLEPLYADEAG
jgi:RNA polymerase sigma-70 factor (ECF subfamily)